MFSLMKKNFSFYDMYYPLFDYLLEVCGFAFPIVTVWNELSDEICSSSIAPLSERNLSHFQNKSTINPVSLWY